MSHTGLRATAATEKDTRKKQPIMRDERKNRGGGGLAVNVLMETVHLNAGT